MSYSAAQTFLKQNGYMCEEEEDVSDTSSDSEPIQLTKQDVITFITTGDITQLIKQKCKEISEILKINDDEALILLNYYQWRIEPLKNDWVQDRVKISKEAGIEPREAIPVENSENMCLICSRRKSREEFDSIACNHLICKECWTDCIQNNMTWSDELFFWKCPVKGCNMVIPDSLNHKYINGAKKVQYENRKVVAYTQNVKAFKWCPIPTCQYGVDHTDKKIQAIECPCGYVYCKECGQEDHRPLTCQLTTDWLEKHYPKFSIEKLPDYVNNFQCCDAELEIIEDLSKCLKFREYYGSDGIYNVIQGACKTLRDTKRLEKWSYAYISFINFEQNGELLRFKLEIQQESLDKYTKELQKLLKGVYGLVSEQYKGGIQLTETKCKKILARFLDFADKIIYPPGHVKESEPQNPQKGKKWHFWIIPLCFMLISVFFATLDTD